MALRDQTAQLRFLLESKLKWTKDDTGDRYCPWFLGDEDEPVATVSPYWGPTRGSGVGKPDGWQALLRGKRVGGNWPDITQAKKAVDAALAAEDKP